MQEQLISFETAKLAKEKGFDVPVWDYFQVTCSKQPSECRTPTKSNWNTYNEYEVYSRPTQSLLQRWIREVHNIDVNVLPYNKNKKYYEVWVEKANITWSNFSTYEEALEKGLQEALNLIK